jgi:beta-N-acetylhexosaminidase
VDSHLELPLVEHPPDRIRRVECVPFVSAIKAGVAFIMTAHVLVPSLDDARPATLSPRVVQAMLREELGFEGVILSDDLEMKAIAATYSVPDAAVQAIAAGCDGLLICSGNAEVQADTLEALVHAVEDGRIPFKRLEDAHKRLRAAKERMLTQLRSSAGPSHGRAPSGARLRRAPRVADDMARDV